ncbi:hypothetical protein HMPREF9733_00064 [Treponema denticola SP33]|uniref:Uncharacterized protein n=1 Tax=Treponema denticola SP33 TaxID=999437 RepID=M2AZM0_TREDN|nr:hypothetical protein [Treponema denticola]EMB28836.1 hypothetical protein HMPREF9733_00064 [Treponema denticola SP33]EPF36238.1 hypothetical protein HMPREF9732_01844 [Treponema denticola SP32]
MKPQSPQGTPRINERCHQNLIKIPSGVLFARRGLFFCSNAEDARIFLKETLKLIKNRAILYANDRKTH